MKVPDEADWGRFHCADLAAEAVRQKSGRDVWALIGLPSPRSWREAAAVYRRLGVRCLADAVTKVLGPPIDRRQARRGDVVMVRGSLGVCAGEMAICVGAIVPLREAEQAWASGNG